MTQVLIAPDCFGDTLTAVVAAEAIAAGWRAGRPGDVLVTAPQSDGGPGFVDVLAERLGGRRELTVSGPLGAPVTAAWVCDGDTAYIESAQAVGLALLDGPPTPATALAADSAGVGQLIAAALAAGARRIVVGLGGSCCTDGGRGMVEALGGRDGAVAALTGVDLIAATDVEHPLLGPTGAAAVFGPQKGADPATVAILERRLAGWAAELGLPAEDQPGAGAAGGLGAALLALGARRESGATVIAEHTGLAADIDAAGLIITGEGRFDDQSLHGKVISALTGRARARGVPVLVLAGQVTLGAQELAAAGVRAAHSLVDYTGSAQRAMADADNALRGLAERTAIAWEVGE
ncbi:glycerate kinase family protein [Mycolicibacterium brumae]|uniref:Glycerate kinase n=1 Tax=Mycolicibacterium brumae TaxID=85968 RepID=A0A2G5P728_9MYCO|nr:glycerate kinase [Mycolicibacterium brumae]MCV7191220.1 glycerate kinase [Mycolicibacterium brumae]PIB73694.1 glycerate kinase [Mycolicibacterium brumae]RWA19572.1 hypothetical protein MBRU_16575 [Mycolicibacterium brumae DSM 44177]UWW08342.1 glycerate kinase [Mycolicibacterium brumae]